MRRDAVEVPWPAALALVQEIAAVASTHGWPGMLAVFRLRGDGSVEVSDTAREEGSSAPAIPTLAAFLEELLPPPGATVELRVPAGLRYTLVRGRGGVTAPPFASLEEFSGSLVRFEHGDRHALLAALAARVFASQPAITSAPYAVPAPESVPPVLSREPSPFLREDVVPVPEWDQVPLAAVDDVTSVVGSDPSRQLLMEDSQPTRKTRRQAGPVLTAVAVLSILIAAAVVGAAVLVSLDRFGPTPRHPRVAHAARVDTAQPATPREQAQLRSSPTEQNSSSEVEPQAAPPANGPGTPASVGTSAASASPSPGDEPAGQPDATGTDTGRPGDMVEALDLGNQPVFSPSFAADGSAVFFDEQGEAGGSALKEARTGSGGRVVQVLSVVADGARNYHPRLSPDGSQVAFDSDRDGVRGVYISDRAGQNIRRVSGAGYAAVPTWSPDGSRLAFVKAEPDKPRVWNIWILKLARGETTRVTSYRYGQPWGASWLPDGRRICYSHEDRLIVLDLDTGESQTYGSPRKGALVRTPAVSPDGQRVIFQLHGDGAWMLDLTSGKMQKVLDDPSAEEFAWSPDGRRVAFHSRRDRQWGISVLAR